MLGKRGPPYSALIYSVDASGFEQTDYELCIMSMSIMSMYYQYYELTLNCEKISYLWICNDACDFAAAVTEGGFWGASEKPDYY